MQRTTYAEDSMSLFESEREPLYAKVVDCALGILDPDGPKCLDLAALDARFGGPGPAPVAAIYDYIKVSDVKANNTPGGNFPQGAWRTRNINTEDSDTGGHAALAANQITLQAGTYICLISAPAFRISRHKARLRNITAGATTLLGTGEVAVVGDSPGLTRSFIVGRFTIAAATVFEVQHRCEVTDANGFGIESNFGVDEVYTLAEFWREPD